MIIGCFKNKYILYQIYLKNQIQSSLISTKYQRTQIESVNFLVLSDPTRNVVTGNSQQCFPLVTEFSRSSYKQRNVRRARHLSWP